MIRIKEENVEKKDKTIVLGDMQPLEIAQVVGDGMYKDEYIMRTASVYTFEVLRLTRSGPDHCWTGKGNTLEVRLLGKDEKITLEIFNS